MTGFDILGVLLYGTVWLILLFVWKVSLVILTVAEFTGHHGCLSKVTVLVDKGTRVHRVVIVLAVIARVIVK